MAELIACRGCLQPNCEGCNINTLANMLFSGKFDRLMDEHHCVSPEAEFAPVVHGRWVDRSDRGCICMTHPYVCNRCGRVEMLKEPYCNCGAKMDAELLKGDER